jgi:hypothetical protein
MGLPQIRTLRRMHKKALVSVRKTTHHCAYKIPDDHSADDEAKKLHKFLTQLIVGLDRFPHKTFDQ